MSSVMEIDFEEYKLRCQLRGHDDDVRGICVCGNEGIATSSRDRTVKFWSLDPSDNRNYLSSKVLLGHSSFVGPLAWISPNDQHPEGGLVSGGMDTLVLVWDLRTGEKVQTLKGHQLQITGIAFDDGDIVSSSVDCTLRRWRNGQPVEFWEAHKAAIQAVIKLPSGELVTGSSDTTLKLWKGRKCVHTFSGHTDTVRGLAVMAGLGILSASHDGSIRLWALSGEVLMEMVGHTSIVYSVDCHGSGLIVSGSEDCSAKIWKDGACVQTIEHPGCVWDAKFLENGDVITACSDGIIRLWTVHHDKIADPPELEKFFSQLSQYKISRKRVGGLKLDELPGIEALKSPGTSDGQTKVIREGDNGVAYAWSMREWKWDKIGEVVDGPEDGMKRPGLDGVEYDYVFDVDIGDGEPIRKLPYNRSDNPYDTADKWLLKENLPLSYRQQIVEFILQNSGQKNSNFDSSFCDPYTGSSAYIPGEPSNMSAANKVKPTFKHIPKKGMLVFDVAQFDGIFKKITEFNNALLSELEKKNLSLTELELSRLGAILKNLKDTSHYHCTSFADTDVDLLLKLLKSWPVAMIFPVIDVLRMVILHPDGASVLLKHIENENDALIELIKKVTADPSLPANLLTTIRAVTNLFKNSYYCNWLQKHRSDIIDAFSSCYTSPNKNLQLSYSTLLLNYAVLLIDKKDEEGQSHVLSAALEIAEEENQEVDSKFRALVAIGSLMLEGLVKKVAVDFDVASVANVAKASKEAKISEVGADIELLIKQS
ncbi:WD40 domain-containing protein/PUL domain-containing protein/PFU domain-containing protein [Cephalotus follicularis]|uniref:WD40 domain-containing protein/PUL domain-containing protein/PFU domain-containing protein n=1 Tax=Cephalotus follicularis TaxID=3775 RepID=A0A1Q3BGQ4_CEPFO|nr:WD40 domain-containing protein/PUL domain-containing protein/PFU domain-containing protein [Cephalotus follicularis]